MSVDTLEPKASGSKAVNIYVRTQHMTYVQHVAKRDEISLSRALRNIIAANASVLQPPTALSRQERFHVCLGPENIKLLDAIARALGLDRSEVMRRLIDKAMDEDPPLRLVG